MASFFRLSLFLFLFHTLAAQQLPDKWKMPKAGETLPLHSGWWMKQLIYPSPDGNTLTSTPFQPQGWLPATVPGTVLTTLVNCNLFPNPDFGMNNELIPDISAVGKDFYSCWYLNRFTLSRLEPGQHLWLNLRGINYRADIFLNGHRVNREPLEGMFLRRSFDISKFVREEQENTLAIQVLPPDPAGTPNGGQGGDGLIARNNTMQFTAGWDWIQPVRDRNTGLWDQVTLTTTGPVRLLDPYIHTRVPGKRVPGSHQADAFISVAGELENIGDQTVKGEMVCLFEGKESSRPVELKPHSRFSITLQDIRVSQPRLWWPNGMGEAALYPLRLFFRENKNTVLDQTALKIGIREITSSIDSLTGGRQFYCNGQKVFIRGGNWIASDWMLRLSPERYATEVKFHHDMNLNMIRVWGGGITERPEFYEACDENGILVMQDLWVSGDCNGAWNDARKKESQLRRSEYPDNHSLFISSAIDQVRMLRNHPSLCFWSGGNEWAPAKDLLAALQQEVLPVYDPYRLFISHSTSPELTLNYLKDGGDGPYGLQEPEWFFTFRSHPFNPELGSVGFPEAQTFHETFDQKDLWIYKEMIRNTALMYHKYTGYGDQAERYGSYKTLDDYVLRAQLINYQQYQAFMEGWTSHMWEWYTGILIWKTQNPWTALRGQMYDHGLDQNACFYGLRSACEPVHIFWNRHSNSVGIYNTTLTDAKGLKATATFCKLDGTMIPAAEVVADSKSQSVTNLFDLKIPENLGEVGFLQLDLKNEAGKVVSSNFYWISATGKEFKALTTLAPATVETTISKSDRGFALTMSNKEKTPAFFMRLHIVDPATGRRILPVHYSDNYLSLLPGETRTVEVELPSPTGAAGMQLQLKGWNVDQKVALSR